MLDSELEFVYPVLHVLPLKNGRYLLYDFFGPLLMVYNPQTKKHTTKKIPYNLASPIYEDDKGIYFRGRKEEQLYFVRLDPSNLDVVSAQPNPFDDDFAAYQIYQTEDAGFLMSARTSILSCESDKSSIFEVLFQFTLQ